MIRQAAPTFRFCVFLVCLTILSIGMSACQEPSPGNGEIGHTLDESDYCFPKEIASKVLTVRPGETEDAIDDINWFARPVPHQGTDHIVAFASHDQNYLYNLSAGRRIRIPDRSDAVATPDGRYMTVPSNYTPDSTIRFYDLPPLLEKLASGEDADETPPAFVHEHSAMSKVYYQSTAIVSEEIVGDTSVVTYRLMFSGTSDESKFRIVDYRFVHDATTQELREATASAPMALCPEVTNDLNTPFISKDARHVAAYTSSSSESAYSTGASLKIFEILSIHPAQATTECRQVLDLGFAAGKADFSFDGSMLSFHISQGGYLTPFINGGLEPTTITDVVTVKLSLDDLGNIVGQQGLRRLTTSIRAGVGSYFPAFFPDGTLFYIANTVPKNSDRDKRFEFRVVDPRPGHWVTGSTPGEGFASQHDAWAEVSSLWQEQCSIRRALLNEPPFPLKPHEAPWMPVSLSSQQCRLLLSDSRLANAERDGIDWDGLEELCSLLAS